MDTNKINRIGVVTLGCSKNTVDSERLIGQLKLNNFVLTDDLENADSLIINTCGFIQDAKEESINTILNAVELKNKGQIKKIIVAGCLSSRYSGELAEEIPEVDLYAGTEDYSRIISNLGGNLKNELLGERELLTPKHYAYFKISEGCSNPCSFCAIPIMRGMHKSRLMDDLIFEAGLLARKGVKELIVIGQDTTDYGKDLYGKRNLAELLSRLSGIGSIEWIRLLYAYPSHFPDDLIGEIARNPKICKYLDIPLQHISDKILKSMRRGISSRRTKELIFKLRERIPDIALRTTFIIGYPGETEREFGELCSFIKEVKFDRLGVFGYSREENTQAYDLGDSVPDEEKKERISRIMEIQREISLNKNEELIGRELKVILDGVEGEYYIARSEKETPEVDGEILVKIDSKPRETGNFYQVKILDCTDYDLFAIFT